MKKMTKLNHFFLKNYKAYLLNFSSSKLKKKLSLLEIPTVRILVIEITDSALFSQQTAKRVVFGCIDF